MREMLHLVLFSLLTAPMVAQVAPAPDAPPSADVPGSIVSRTAPAPSQRGVQEDRHRISQLPSPLSLPAFRATTNLVNLFFVARDSHRQLVSNLTKSDCMVSEDNTRQILETLSIRADLPLTLGVLLDTSLSQQNVLAMEKQAGNAFLREILKPKDEAFLMSFDVNVDQLADLTGSLRTLEQAMNAAGINSSSGNYANGTVPSIGKPKGTLLYDAVYLASTDKLRQEAGRKALVVLTDGQDEGSQKSLKSAIEAAQKSDAIIYVLLISDPGPYGMLDFSGSDAIRKLAKETGGHVFEIGHDGRKMQSAFRAIESELRQEYEATYRPSNSARDGTYRRIRVDCLKNGKSLRVRARQGYYAEQEVKAAGTP